MRNHHVIAATVAATMLAFAVPAVAGPITYNQAMTAARDAAKRDRAKWPVASKTILKGPRCNRVDAVEFRCAYRLNGPLDKNGDRLRSCTRKVSVTLPDGAKRPTVKRTASACGGVTHPG